MGQYSLQERLGITEVNLQMAGWQICGYGNDPGFKYDRLFQKFERKGAFGYTLTRVSKFELRLIRKWVKGKKAEGRWIYAGPADNFNDVDDKRVCGFDNSCYDWWFENEALLEEFVKFLESMPSRRHELVLDNGEYEDVDVQRLIKKLKGNKLIITNGVVTVISSEHDLSAIDRQRKLICTMIALDETIE